MAQEKKHISISEVNSLSYEDFISTFGNVVEHSALCAAAIWTYRPFKDVTEIQSRISEFLDILPLSGMKFVFHTAQLYDYLPSPLLCVSYLSCTLHMANCPFQVRHMCFCAGVRSKISEKFASIQLFIGIS
jgi:hypothetical protein